MDGFMVVDLPDEAATERAGEELALRLRPGDFVAIDGDLGAGKTTLVRGIARGLGIDPLVVASPTFVTVQAYTGGRLPLVHIDLWRVGGQRDPGDTLESIGWDEIVSDTCSVTVAEWANLVASVLPCRRLDVRLTIRGTARTIEITDQRSCC